LEGQYDNYPEDAFRQVGRIEEVVEKAKKMGFAPDTTTTTTTTSTDAQPAAAAN
ncbi:F0F1 ATP synthase subunit beta, partial [Lacticaseibacillus saniviri]|nr:F0F1 ATP synthase subunit beta [Lacticaseibacillus saniviri]